MGSCLLTPNLVFPNPMRERDKVDAPFIFLNLPYSGRRVPQEIASQVNVDLPMAYHQLRIAKIVQETPDARSFVLEVPDDLADRFRYRAGQFLTFRVPHDAGAFNRCYSLSSAPETDGRHLKVTVKRVRGGKGSNWFNDALAEGNTLHVLPPAGRFVLREGHAPLLLFGGGSGITPMMSLIKSALRSGTRRIRLFYANRDKPSIIFDKELLGLLADH